MKSLPQKRSKRTEDNPPFREVLISFLGLNEHKDEGENSSEWVAKPLTQITVYKSIDQLYIHPVPRIRKKEDTIQAASSPEKPERRANI